MLKSKFEVPTSVQNFITFVEKQFYPKVKVIRIVGTEFSMP